MKMNATEREICRMLNVSPDEDAIRDKFRLSLNQRQYQTELHEYLQPTTVREGKEEPRTSGTDQFGNRVGAPKYIPQSNVEPSRKRGDEEPSTSSEDEYSSIASARLALSGASLHSTTGAATSRIQKRLIAERKYPRP
jgi:hypothetical protein